MLGAVYYRMVLKRQAPEACRVSQNIKKIHEVISKFDAGYRQQDPRAISRLFAREAVFKTSLSQKEACGRENIEKLFEKAFSSSITDIEVENKTINVDGFCAVIERDFHARHKDSLERFSNTDKLKLYFNADFEIIRHENHVDQKGFKEQDAGYWSHY